MQVHIDHKPSAARIAIVADSSVFQSDSPGYAYEKSKEQAQKRAHHDEDALVQTAFNISSHASKAHPNMAMSPDLMAVRGPSN